VSKEKEIYYVKKENFRAYDTGTETEKTAERQNPDAVQLKDDGNVTKQIYDAIGFETLQSHYNVYQKNEES
jgi:hypothetical protein